MPAQIHHLYSGYLFGTIYERFPFQMPNPS